MPKTAPFRALIATLIRVRYHTAQAVADAIGMSLSALTRGVRDHGTLSTAHCLRLAEAAGSDPAHVLRLAQKADAAAVLDRVYGKPATLLSDDDRVLVALDPQLKHQLLRFVAGLEAVRK